MPAAYYNEIDPFAAAWLRNLVAAGHIAPGDVDERSIRDVQPSDLIGYTQCHFFAGIGVWSYALRRAGWNDARPVWTGSCPCQPFSAAGKRTGTADDRHLWPEFFRLIGAHRPHVVFGEQVASKDGLSWLDAVQADLEGAGYAFGALDLCAAGFGAPHIRQRLFFVADAGGARAWRDAGTAPRQEASSGGARGADGMHGGHALVAGGPACELAYAECDTGGPRRASVEPTEGARETAAGAHDESGRRGVLGELGDAGGQGLSQQRCDGGVPQGQVEPFAREGAERAGASAFWSSCDWLPCIDGKARPVEPGSFPLAHGVAGRVGRLRAYGNAIVAPVAEEFIRAFMSEATSTKAKA